MIDNGRYRINGLEGNHQLLDGGAMFGNAPKTMWSSWVGCDELNRIRLSCRSFLIRDGDNGRNILLEAGIGSFMEPRLKARFGVGGTRHELIDGLADLDLAPDQIDFIVLSHLHFDHAGGLLKSWKSDREPSLAFPRAQFITSERAWKRARNPHTRDKASFIPFLTPLLEASGRLQLVAEGKPHPLGADFSFTISDGHTPGQLLTWLQTARGSVAFAGDLVPGIPWIHVPITMGYDRFPERAVEEKEAFLIRAEEMGATLLLVHDADHGSSCVIKGDKRRFISAEPGPAVFLMSL